LPILAVEILKRSQISRSKVKGHLFAVEICNNKREVAPLLAKKLRKQEWKFVEKILSINKDLPETTAPSVLKGEMTLGCGTLRGS
jgi:hypothetical protein